MGDVRVRIRGAKLFYFLWLGGGCAIVRAVVTVRRAVKAVARPAPAARKSPPKPKAKSAPKHIATPKKRVPRGVYIDHVQWENGNRLRVYPTTATRFIAPQRWSPVDELSKRLAWEEVVKMAPGANKNNMKEQFICHWDFVSIRAPRKESWNLDMESPAIGYWGSAFKQCNP